MLDLTNVWPEWQAVEKVGEGSYGKVYRCVREEFGIQSVCAIKAISLPQNDGGVETMRFEGMSEAASWAYLNELVKDFTNEIKVMEMLKGAPNVVSVENYKIVKRTKSLGWDIFIRMEFLQTFPDYTEKHRLSENDVLRLGLDICTALEVCARKGIIHRDIKPDNIFVDDYGKFKLGDFGVARQLERSLNGMSRKGTYSYMAPEVYREEHYDGRADIYSLGMVMYKLLNNNRDPFIDPHQPMIKISERSEAINRRRRGEKIPVPAFATPATASLILKACEFNPDDRFLTVTEFKKAINDIMNGNVPEQKPAHKKISVFEIDTVGEKLFGEHSKKEEEKEALIHTPTVVLPKDPTNRPSYEETKIFSSHESEKFDKNLLKSIPKPFEMNDPETDGKKKRLNSDSSDSEKEKKAEKAEKPKPVEPEKHQKATEAKLPPKRPETPKPEKAAVPAPAPKPVSAPKPAPTPKPTQTPKSAPAPKPTKPVAPPPAPKAPSVPKQLYPSSSELYSDKDEKGSGKGAKAAKIIAVLVFAGLLVVLAAFIIPSLVEGEMKSEDSIDTEIDYTEISTEESGDYVVYGYNEDGLLIEENYYNADDEFEGCTEYVYDEDENKTGYKEYNEQNKLVYEHKY